MSRIETRFDQIGISAWTERRHGVPPGAQSQALSELSAPSYTRIFRALREVAGRDSKTLCDLGAGCGRALAHAVSTGGFTSANGVEIVPGRVAAGQKALADLRISSCRLEVGDFSEVTYSIQDPCVLSYDLVFDTAVLDILAPKLNASPCLALASFKSPQRWEAAGLDAFELVSTGRVQSSGDPPEKFTFFLYKRV